MFLAVASKMRVTNNFSLFYAIAFFLVSGCQESANICNLRLVEVVSSDNKVACICENTPDGLGATTSRSFSIHIFEKSGGPTANNRVMIATNLDNSELFWKDGLVLEVVFEDARIYSFRNYWYPEKVTAQTEPIRIVLREKRTKGPGSEVSPRITHKVPESTRGQSQISVRQQ